MTERLEQEIAILRRVHEDVEVDPGGGWVILKRLPLPSGWNRDHTDVLVTIPPGYPTTPPDNFYTEPDLRLATGAKPGRAPREKKIAGSQRLMFSWHVEADQWEPDADPQQGHNLLTYVTGVKKRLSDPS